MKIKSLLGFQVTLIAMTFASVIPTSGIRGQDRGGPPANEKAQNDADAKQLRKKRLAEMRRRAEKTQVFRLRGAERTLEKMIAEPVLRYSDQARRMADATLWILAAQGRPSALLKVSYYRNRPDHPRWEYCLASLCDDLIEVRWAGEPGWSSTKPGVELRVLPGAPKPAATQSGRTLQMKEAFRRFSGTITDTPEARDEFRLITKPLHRYSDPASGIQDGAIFAFVDNGTNPDALMLIELRGPDLARAAWHYGPIRMTTSQVNVRLDGKDVWTFPPQWVPGRNAYDTWIAFFPSRNNPNSMDDPVTR